MSLRPKTDAAPTLSPAAAELVLNDRFAHLAVTKDVGRAMRTVAPSPYNDKAHLSPKEYEDHDGGPWNDAPVVRPTFESVPLKWVVAPSLGAEKPAICVFPRRLSNNISFAPDVHLSFSAVWTPIVARFSQLFLTDVDKKGHMPEKGQQQHWISTFKGKTDTGMTSVVLRIRCNNDGSQMEGWALYLPDTDYVISFVDMAMPAKHYEGTFDSYSAIVCNGAMSAFSEAENRLESLLDRTVETETRLARAEASWKLFKKDLKQRSDVTMQNINDIRSQLYNAKFLGRARNADLWNDDPNRAPDI